MLNPIVLPLLNLVLVFPHTKNDPKRATATANLCMLTNTVQPFTIYTMKIDSVFTSCVYYVGMATVINVPFSIKPFPPFGHSEVFFVFFALLSDQFGDSMSTQCTNSMFSDKNVERKKRYTLFSSGYMCFMAIELNAAKVQRRKKGERPNKYLLLLMC